jgi:cell pole-organizing protein PopZ
MALEREISSPEAEVAPEPTYVRTAPRAATVEAYQEEEEVGYDEPLRHAEAGDRSPGDVALASDALFSAATDASVTSAFKTLAATRLADNSDELLEIARDMIRPLLKTWIDNNLPSMVERLVRAEIERVSRGGR